MMKIVGNHFIRKRDARATGRLWAIILFASGTLALPGGVRGQAYLTNKITISGYMPMSSGGGSSNAALLVVSPGSLNFGSVVTGATAAASLTVSNAGSLTLSGTVTSTVSVFSFGVATNFSAAGGTTTNIPVDFAPAAISNYTGQVYFASNGGASTNQVTGSGTTNSSGGLLFPAGSTVNWQLAGVLGDIPVRNTIYTNIVPSGDTSGATDYNNITGALGSCPPNEVVRLTNGTYYTTGYITLPSLVTLRGSGMSNSGSAWTVVRPVSQASGYWAIFGLDPGGAALASQNSSVDSSAVGITAGLSQGSTNITTASAHGLSVGQIVLIDQTNILEGGSFPPVTIGPGGNGDGPTDVRPYSGTQHTRGMGQLDKVVGVPNATNLTLEIPLYYNYDPTRQPQITSVGSVVSNSGIEYMTLDNSTNAVAGSPAGNQANIVALNSAANCWLLNVDAYASTTYGIRFNVAYRCTVRSSKARFTSHPSAPDGGYGISSFDYSSACLVENSQGYANNTSLIADGVTSGNVYAYNLLLMLQGSGQSDREDGTLLWHGAFPMFNLYEGNYFDGECLGDNYHGNAGFNTLYANRHFVNLLNAGTPVTQYTRDVDLWEDYRNYNIVANVFGTNGFETAYQFFCPQGATNPVIYAMGNSNGVDDCSNGTDPQVNATTFRHANFDTVTGGIVYSNGFTHTLTNSLYLTTQPTWWSNVAWPLPFNPNNAGNGMMGPLGYTNIQAGVNYSKGN
jgi:hypothetical protein